MADEEKNELFDETSNNEIEIEKEEIEIKSDIVDEKKNKEDLIKEIANKIKEESENIVDKKEVRKRPSLFVNDEKIKVEVSVLYSYTTGEILSVFAHTLPIEDKLKELMGVEELEFEFSKMSYDQLRGYREICSYVDPNTNALQINSLKMRDCYVYYHLKGWNIKNEEGNDIEIKFTEAGELSEESRKLFYNLSPAIIDIAINEFENKLNI